MTGLEALNDLIEDLQQDNGVSIICKEKVENELKALEIIKSKKVEIYWLYNSDNVESYNKHIANLRDTYSLTEEEFNLLKEVLE